MLYKILANTPSIKFVVYDGEPSENLAGDINAVRESIQVFSIDEIRELGKSKPTEPLRARLPKPETMACIMYTSGSTGPPKGVCITHANLVASIGAVYKLLGHHLTYDDTYLASPYVLIMLFVGMTSGYGRVKTLTDASVRQCKETWPHSSRVSWVCKRTTSSGGPDSQLHTGRTKSKRGDKRPDANKAPPGTHHQQYGHAGTTYGPGGIPLEPVAPSRPPENRRDRKAIANVDQDQDSPEIVDRKAKPLLKLSMEKFDLNANKYRCCCCHKGNAAPTTIAKIHEAVSAPDLDTIHLLLSKRQPTTRSKLVCEGEGCRPRKTRTPGK
ncbi:long-chain-fatty-acid- -ligase [Lentinula edodes]|uniref:Long-chain-fatty-acid--ligase n=1 Tax=Lentinula edodes TaxID=5353 RepID=A0A1Q3ET87_LENED|nr:long-chain-fatty-acid- -ligase [Lentinula edodes]